MRVSTVVDMQMTERRLDDEAELVRAYWEARVSGYGMTAGSCARYQRVLASFVRFVSAHRLESLTEASAGVCSAFVNAPQRTGLRPAPATSRFRLTVVRDAYIALRKAGQSTADPTTDLRVTVRPRLRSPVPLTPSEAARLRSAGRTSPRDYLRPATVELALAGGSHIEIASVVFADLELHKQHLRLGARRAHLDSFATATLTARLAACRRAAQRACTQWDPNQSSVALARPLRAYPPTSIAPSVSSSLRRAMTSAGLHRLELRPASVREYAANCRYATDGIESAAEFLGLESLDVARGFIQPSWQQLFAREVRSR